jgi:hypothetical protein
MMSARLRPVVETPGGYVWQAGNAINPKPSRLNTPLVHYSNTPLLPYSITPFSTS